MTTQPQQPLDPTAMLSQMLIEQGKQGVQLAVISEQLKDIPDHESRLRALERFRFTIAGASVFGGALSGFLGYLVGHIAIK